MERERKRKHQLLRQLNPYCRHLSILMLFPDILFCCQPELMLFPIMCLFRLNVHLGLFLQRPLRLKLFLFRFFPSFWQIIITLMHAFDKIVQQEIYLGRAFLFIFYLSFFLNRPLTAKSRFRWEQVFKYIFLSFAALDARSERMFFSARYCLEEARRLTELGVW